MHQDIIKILEDMKDTAHGGAVRAFIEEKINEMNRLDDVQGSITELGEEVKARQKVTKILRSLFSVIDVDNKKVNKVKYN